MNKNIKRIFFHSQKNGTLATPKIDKHILPKDEKKQALLYRFVFLNTAPILSKRKDDSNALTLIFICPSVR